jgi:predicted esterase
VRVSWRSALVGGALALGPIVLRGQSVSSATPPIDTVARRIDGDVPVGRVVQRLVSRADTTQRYALYLPSSFARERQWPVLFLLDPRGRALVPMERFQPAAERLGYIVISSYNTLSDGPIQPNYVAMNAMLADVQDHLPVDTRRFYMVGFSGTARFAWQMSTQAPGTIAGIVGTGASVPGGRSWIRSNIGKSSPALFGTIGTLDPNYEEVRELDAELDVIGTAHHIERFDGGHQWPPTDLSTRAVEWLELNAMQRGLKPRDQRWVDSVFASWLARAARVDSAGDAPGAARAYKLVVGDFRGLTDVTTAETRLAALRSDARVRRAEAAEAAVAERDAQLLGALFAFVADLKRAPSPPSADDARKRLDLDRLRRDATRTDDSTTAIASRRALERIFSHLSFYAPRELFDARRYAHAAAALRVARLIKPDDAFACLSHARALAQTGDRPNALQALECAAASKQVTAGMVESDPLLEPLRGDARYQAAVRQLPPGR